MMLNCGALYRASDHDARANSTAPRHTAVRLVSDGPHASTTRPRVKEAGTAHAHAKPAREHAAKRDGGGQEGEKGDNILFIPLDG